MHYRTKMVFKAMLDAFLGKVADPQSMMESMSAEAESALISIRKELARALATEAQLKSKIEATKSANGSTNELEKQLTQAQAEISKLRKKLDELETLEYHYTEMRSINAVSKTTLVGDKILVAKAITEDGATFDRELAPAPNTKPKPIPTWLIAFLSVLFILFVTFVCYCVLG